MLNYKNIISHGTTFKTIYVGVWNNSLYNKWFYFMKRVQLSHDCRITARRQFTLNHQVHSPWLRRPVRHKVVLNQWPINWKSCTVSTTPLYRLGSTILNPFKNGIKMGETSKQQGQSETMHWIVFHSLNIKNQSHFVLFIQHMIYAITHTMLLL